MHYLSLAFLSVLLVFSINSYASENVMQKVAVLDWMEAVMSSKISAPKIKELKDYMEKQQAELLERKTQLEKEQSALTKNLKFMTEKEKETEQKKFMLKVQEYNLLAQEFQKHKMQQEQALVEQMRPQVDAVIADIIEEFKYTLVLNKPMVVFSKPEDNITELVIKRLDAVYAKSAK